MCSIGTKETISVDKYKCTYTCDVTGSATMEMRMIYKRADEDQTSICDIKAF